MLDADTAIDQFGAQIAAMRLQSESTAPSSARRYTRTVLRHWQVSSESIETAELLVSELVTNAITVSSGQHGIRLILRRQPSSIAIEVSDHSQRPPVLSEVDADMENGRGLLLVQALSEKWGYFYPIEGGKTVFCILQAVSIVSELSEIPSDSDQFADNWVTCSDNSPSAATEIGRSA